MPCFLPTAPSAVAAIALSLVFALIPAKAAYPDKPIKLIVPWAPGGSTDAISRAMAHRMSETLGVSVLVDNRPGLPARLELTQLPNQRQMDTPSR
jgi:tripartite-type tricarboxylate transporter receptor subunit TctC